MFILCRQGTVPHDDLNWFLSQNSPQSITFPPLKLVFFCHKTNTMFPMFPLDTDSPVGKEIKTRLITKNKLNQSCNWNHKWRYVQFHIGRFCADPSVLVGLWAFKQQCCNRFHSVWELILLSKALCVVSTLSTALRNLFCKCSKHEFDGPPP